MSLKLVVSDKEYSKLVRDWVRASFKANDFFEKYNTILPLDTLIMIDKRLSKETQKRFSIVEKCVRISDII